MALTLHYTRNEDGTFDRKRYNAPPMEYVVANIPDGVPIRIYRGEIGDDTEVTENFEALKEDDVFHIIEGAGGGGGFLGKLLDPLGVLKFVTKLISPSQKTPKTSLANQQAESPNNSLTDRNNKSRPYERSYDICGRVQTIPNDLMTTYKIFDESGRIIEYGYYDAGRGYLDIKAEDITDGDTKVQEITGTSVAVYAPFTSPNNTNTPQLLVGEPIHQNLYITIASNEVDGAVLRAKNDIRVNPSDTGRVRYDSATKIGYLYDDTGDSGFAEILSVGDTASFNNFDVPDVTNTNGNFRVLYVDNFELRVDTGGASNWAALGSTTYSLSQRSDTWVGPVDTYERTLTDWTTLNRLEVERVVANIAAANGMYKDNGSKLRTSVTVEIQYQLLDETGVPYGGIYSKQAVISGRSADYTGVTIYADLPVRSKVRVRARRVTNLDLDFEGTVVDEVSYINLYGQVRDTTPHYGNRTTVHSARKQTPRAAEIKQPQLRMVATEMVYKYLGNGVFDTVMTPNTQAIQSLIRLARDPVVGNLNLTISNMDKLLSTQTEIENYFGNAEAGQFCYTFDDYKTTMQDIVSTIADAIFCTPYRKGQDILLDFERPRIGPEMVFTHRSKTTASEKWTRTFNDAQVYDSLKFSYIDPDTNVKETISIPAEGGVNTETYDSKGIRNYRQAYWAAYRRYQKNLLKKVTVSFTATEEGVFVLPGRAISVVKGSRVAPQDGYVVAVNGLTLTLSQPVTFTPGDDHSLILKKRDGGVQSVAVVPGSHDREVVMLSAPQEAIYTGNSALKTEFSFGNEARHNAQMILVSTVDPGDDRTVKITGINYEADFYKYDGVAPYGSGFSDGFSNGLN